MKVAAALVVFLSVSATVLAQTPRTQTPRKARPAPASSSARAFEQASAAAEAARTNGDLPGAVEAYRAALKLKADWTEGRWALGTALYEMDRFAEARDEFRHVVAAHADNGTAWALKGLCEFRLKQYDTAFGDLLRARALGVTGGRAVSEVARYHTAILATRTEQYEQALAVLTDFALEGNDTPGVIEAMGLAALHMPMLPGEAQGPRRELVMMAGRARYFMAARLGSAAANAFEALITRYPETPFVNYAAGVFYLAEQPDKAVAKFTRELEVFPQNVWARIQMAFALVRMGDFAAAKPYATEAVEQAPTEFVARNVLGQVLLETGDVDGAVRELEAGVKLAADSPQMYFALARAYRRAGRTADADKAQAEFTRLDRLARASRTGEASVGGIGVKDP